jgi:hypothetical protein
MTRAEILAKLQELVDEYDPDDCINWGDMAIEELCDILEESK